MEKLITINNQHNSLDTLFESLKTISDFDCSKEYDRWEMRTETNGEMAKCIVLKKSNMHAIKIYFISDNTLKINHIIPNSIMNAYFGKSQKARKDIIEIVTGKIKEILLAPSQQKAFNELENEIIKVIV
ncbi:hypothetical protein ACSIGC_03320 [Tenacibaculum sp. ZS6-P6]|uniref:hypothetical protein n=1 Tax=Tenacibaculum sp. ZS6-P6 TaxID=3447503 RepID=UPI003F95883E